MDYIEYTAIYVAAPSRDSICKIGMADDPWSRRLNLQSGFPYLLEIYAIYWIKDRYTARNVERYILRDCGFKKLRGDWLHEPAEFLGPILAQMIKEKFGYVVMSQEGDFCAAKVNPDLLVDAERHYYESGPEEEEFVFPDGETFAGFLGFGA